MRICGTRKWPVIDPAEITVKSIIHFFFFFPSSSDRSHKKTANQVGWRQLHYKNKNCNNITAKKLRFWRRKAGLKGSRTHKGENAKWSLSKLAAKLLSLVLKVRSEEMRLVPSFLFQLINLHVWCAINMLLRPLVLTITILHFWSNFFYKRFLFQSSVVFIRGLSKNTTEDGLRNYLENTRRSGGGPVEELKITGNSARVKFESSGGNYTICVRRAWNHVCSERKPTDMRANFQKLEEKRN